MDDLIARIERATEGSGELDDAIARGIGWKDILVGDESRGYFVPRQRVWVDPANTGVPAANCPPAYSRSLDAAITAVPAGYRWKIDSIGVASVISRSTEFVFIGEHSDNQLPLALCIAALKARRKS